MLKDLLGRVFGRKQSTQLTDWRTDKSIFNFIKSHLDSDGKLKDSGANLPDEQKEENKLKFAPGLMDAMFGPEDSEASRERVTQLSQLLKRIASTGDKSSEYEFYQLISGNEGVIGIVDAFLQSIVEDGLPVEPYLYPLARDLAIRSNHRNCVKFGIAILGVCQNKTVLDDIKILGIHDEFTVYATVAISNISEKPAHDLWQLARKVDGWGRIQVVDRMKNMDLTDEIRDWLIREGFRNSIMYEYLAFTCATQGHLHEKLERERIDSELFTSSGEIITALITGGPAEDISDYVYASSVVEDYIRHAKEHIADISDFLVLHRIKDFLSELQKNPTKRKSNAWTDDIISNCLIEIVGILGSRDWKQPTMEGLKSSDNLKYWNAKQAAEKLGIELWDTVWQRLTQNPLNSSSWYDVNQYAKPDRVDQIIDFALKNLPLKQLAVGPKDSMGLGPDYDKFQCLDYVITFLENHPRKGETLVLTALKSPVTRNRNMAIRSLAKWKQENWSNDIRKELNLLKDIEPNKDTKKNIERLLNGHELV